MTNQELKELEYELKEIPFKYIIARKILKEAIKQGIRKSIDINSYFKQGEQNVKI